jgi:hypothetical protein
MRRQVWLAALVAFSAGLSGQSGVPVTTSACGTGEVGLFFWGSGAGANLPASNKATCGTVQSLGVSPDANGRNQLVSFTQGMAPQRMQPPWTGAVSVSQPGSVVVPVQFWLLVPDPHCDFSCIRAWLSRFLDWSNQVLFTERVGIQLQMANAAVVSDETSNPANIVNQFRTVSETKDCTESKLASLAGVIKTNNALNMYLVRRVGSSSYRGTTCFLSPPARDMAFVGADVDYGTMLHEIGHLLGLRHANSLPGLDQRNLMWATSDVRALVTQGQTYWMHFFTGSALPAILDVRSALAVDCNASSTSWACPPVERKIWPE